MASTQENTRESNVYYDIAEIRDQIPEYIEVTGDAEYMRVILPGTPPSNTTVASAPPAGNVMLTPNIANQQLQGSQPPVNPQYQTTSQPQQLPPQPQPQQPYLQPQMPPHQQQTANNQPQQNPVTYPAPPSYQQYDQKGALPPPYQPLQIQTIQPQPIHALPYNMSQQGQGVVFQQPQQFQQMQFRPVTAIPTSDAGQSNSIQGMAITSIVLSAIATVCVLGCLCTIPAIVFGSLALNRSTAADTRKKFAITSMVLTVTAWILYVALILLSIIQ